MEAKGTFEDHAKGLLEFIEACHSPFHVIANLTDKLQKDGFTALRETDDWKLEAGGKYFVTRNNASLIAFRVPERVAQSCKGFHIVASHSDSPSFKVKECPEQVTDGQYLKLNTEKYGGMILSTWLDRPLSLAGRVVIREGSDGDGKMSLVTRLVDLDQDSLVIPNVAIHMNRDMNKGVEYNPQVDMLPLYGGMASEKAEGLLLADIATKLGVDPEQILGHDLYLYVREKGRVIGRDREFVLSPKLDDLQCVYAAMEAFVATVPDEYIPLCAVFDNEEVGSRTRHGADSTFLGDTLERICDVLYDSFHEKSALSLEKRLIAGSFLISADNAHAVHPNHPEKADPTNRPYLNGGIVIKYHGGQKYTTDAFTAAKIKDLCDRAGVPYQTYANRSDIAGGSTLGNLSAGHVPVASADIGLPQLAMHSAVETGGVKDTLYAIRMFEEFWAE